MAFALLLATQTAFAFPDDSPEQSSARAYLNGNQVALLDAALERYRALAADGGWLPLDPGVQLEAGMRHPEVRLLRQRLRISGDYYGEMGADPLFFDAALHSAVQRFQQLHGLRDDGRVSGQTLVLLNLPVETRIAQLEYARAAWAALPEGLEGQRRVWVNVPEAAVSAINGDAVELHMRAVVGHPSRPTPTLSSAIRRIVVNPAWTIPQRIAGEDLLPRQRDDTAFFSERGIQVYTSFSDDNSEISPTAIDWSRINNERFPFRLRQQPGPTNSLGRYKFEFPNDDDIYLHDTPARALLQLSVRSLSSGCVRAQDSAALADWLLQSGTQPTD
ncbi:MAG: L,D-transpeptidase family protein, partial [Gammaproteobacteria bacterium]|nr:L,D-transpeptidase family protein [Gammaproteobacteria bacterium]